MHGGPLLKASQAYPSGYGRATARCIRNEPVDVDNVWVECTILEDDDFDDYRNDGAVQWADADLGDVWAIVQHIFKRGARA